MVIPVAVKAGDPVYGWCDQYKRSVPAKNDEAWTAGQVVVNVPASGYYAKTGSAKQVGSKGIVAQDKPTTDNMGVIYVAPAEVYSKYLESAALKNTVLVQTSATAGGWEVKTADGTYADQTNSIGFAQVMGKAGQLGGSGQGETVTDIAQNELTKLRLL